MVNANVPGAPPFKLLSKPVPGSQPLFLIENATTGQEIVTTDMYAFFDKEKLDWNLPPEHPDAAYYNQAHAYRLEKHNTNWKRLLGYGYVDQPNDSSFTRLSALLDPVLFPQTNRYHLDLWVKR